MERSSTASAHDSAAEHVEPEMRKARDGQPYTREDFDAWFTTKSQASWDAAEPVTASAAEHGQLERRKAWDGQPYTREGFDAWFATRSHASKAINIIIKSYKTRTITITTTKCL